MGVSEGAVRQLMHRARAALRTAVTAVTPAPVANWLGPLRGAPGAGQAPEIALGAGATSTVGVGVKLGAVLASGAVATGLLGSQLASHAGHPAVRHPHRRAVAGTRHASAVAAASSRVVFAVGGVVAQPSGTSVGHESGVMPTATARPSAVRRADNRPSAAGRAGGHDARGGERSGGGRDGGGDARRPNAGGGPEHGDQLASGRTGGAGATWGGRDGGAHHDGASSGHSALMATAPTISHSSSDGSDGGLTQPSGSDGGSLSTTRTSDASGG
jgi:hypothetical protein